MELIIAGFGLLVLYAATIVFDIRAVSGPDRSRAVLTLAFKVVALVVAIVVIRNSIIVAFDDVVQSGGDGLGDIAGAFSQAGAAIVFFLLPFGLDLVLLTRARQRRHASESA